MSLQDEMLEPTDDELCEEHMSYKPCRTCRRQAAIDRAEEVYKRED